MTALGDRETLILSSNKLAMDYLREDKFKESLALLKKAEALLSASEEGKTQDSVRLMCITLNNLGCYYKRRRQPNVAMHYIQQAFDLEIKAGKDPISVAGTHLNLCAIYSQAGKHFEALQHATSALQLVETAIEGSATSNGFTVLTTHVIAYHNVGVELEYQNRLAEAVEAYTKGHEAALQHLGAAHGLTESIAASKAAALARFRNMNSFSEVRKSKRERSRVPSHDNISVMLPSHSRRVGIGASESPRRRLPSLRVKDAPVLRARKSLLFPDFHSKDSFTFLKLNSDEKSKFHSPHLRVMENAIAGTRRLKPPEEQLRAYPQS